MKKFKKNIATFMTLAIIITCMATIANNIKVNPMATVSYSLKDPEADIPTWPRGK